MQDILLGTTDRTVLIFIPDPASTTGAGKTGLNAAALTCTYTRVETDNDVVHTDVTSSLSDLSALTDAHADWGLKEVSSTLSKGLYRLDIADAVFASGAWYAVVQVTITSGTAAATPMAFRLVVINALDGVRLGLTALPNAAADAAGGLPISDAGGLDIDAKLANTNEVTSARMGALTDWINGGRLDLLLDAIKAATDNLPSDPADQSLIIAATNAIVALLGSPAGASVSADVAAVKAQTAAIETDTAEIGTAGAGLTNINLPNQTMDIVGNITGNLSGSVGSVSGAVGSVTGNVGGNVTGSVGSVAGAVGSVTGNVGGNVSGSVGSIASGGITAASFGAGAIDAAAIATDAIGANELAASAITKIQSGLSTLDAAGIRTAVGMSSANLDTQLSAINSKTTNLPSDPADASDISTAFGTVNSTLATIATYVDTEVAAIKVIVDRLGGMIELDGAVYRYTENALEEGPAGGGGGGSFDPTDNVPASPTDGTYDKAFRQILDHVDVDISSRAASGSPGLETSGEVQSGRLVAYQNSNFTFSFVADSDVSAHDLRFIVYKTYLDAAKFELTSDDNDITVSGGGGDQVTVEGTDEHTADIGEYSFVLRDIDDGVPIAVGTFEVRRAMEADTLVP